jgi:hypothetical protein
VLLANPLFTRTAGLAWNHDFPMFFSLLGFLILSAALPNSDAAPNPPAGGDADLSPPRQPARSSAFLVAISGVFFGIAITSRLTFITELLPLGPFIAFFPGISLSRRSGLCAAFCLGCAVACLPTLWIWMHDPVNAYFGNFQYPGLNTRFHAINDDASHHRYTVLSRVWFFITRHWEMPGNGALTVAFVWLLVVALRYAGLRSPVGWRLLAIAGIYLSQVAAGLVPAPPFIQYLYAATPWMVLGVAMCLALVPSFRPNVRLHYTLIGALVLTIAFGIPEYRGLLRLPAPHKWIPIQVHEQGLELTKLTGNSRILTMEPSLPIEGGADIYEQLATGRFAMRVGDFLTPQQRVRYHMFGTDDIPAIFNTDPPAAFLATGTDDGIGLEKAMAAQAQLHGYRRVDLSNNNVVWIAPTPPAK